MTLASLQSGEVGDITAGRPLGPWTHGIADRIMPLYERSWEQANPAAAERDAMRRELADNFCKRIEAKEPYYPYVEYPYIEWFSEANGRVVLELTRSPVAAARLRSITVAPGCAGNAILVGPCPILGLRNPGKPL